MDFLSSYELFLFDLDGLLVDTEELHFRAYAQMCAKRGVQFPWDFPKYFQIAERGGTLIQEELFAACPDLFQQESNWAVLYAEKRAALYEIASQEPLPLMKGVDRLLLQLKAQDFPRAIVTHSPRKLVEIFAKRQPILQSIQIWFCREDYSLPKPHPDGYLKALEHFNWPKKALGFEDTVRGIQSLHKAGIDAVLVGHPDPATRLFWQDQDVIILDRIDEILSRGK